MWSLIKFLAEKIDSNPKEAVIALIAIILSGVIGGGLYIQSLKGQLALYSPDNISKTIEIQKQLYEKQLKILEEANKELGQQILDLQNIDAEELKNQISTLQQVKTKQTERIQKLEEAVNLSKKEVEELGQSTIYLAESSNFIKKFFSKITGFFSEENISGEIGITAPTKFFKKVLFGFHRSTGEAWTIWLYCSFILSIICLTIFFVINVIDTGLDFEEIIAAIIFGFFIMAFLTILKVIWLLLRHAYINLF
jgi:hypothetical protein